MNNGYDLEFREEKVMRRKIYRRVKEDDVLGWRACKIAAAKPSESLNKNTTTGATFISTSLLCSMQNPRVDHDLPFYVNILILKILLNYDL